MGQKSRLQITAAEQVIKGIRRAPRLKFQTSMDCCFDSGLTYVNEH